MTEETGGGVLGSFDAPPPDAEDALARARLPHTDVGNAERLRMAHGRDLRFVPGLGWVVWNGRIWEAEFGESAALTMASTLPDLLLEESAALSSAPVPKAQLDAWLAENEGATPDEGRKAIRAARKRSAAGYAKTCGALPRLNAALTLLRDHCRARIADLDPFPFRVTAPNGELDLARLAAEAPDPADCSDGYGEAWGAHLRSCLAPHRRESLSTRSLDAALDPGADCPGWTAFLEAALPDPAMRAFAQRIAGYFLSGRNNLRICVVLIGPGGNGKSAFSSGLAKVLGSYAAACRIQMFLESRVAAQGPTPEEAVLPGARAYISSEPEADDVFSGSKIKGLTGGEKRQAHAKGKAPFEWIPNGTPIISVNDVPRITDTSEGMWRRLTFLPFKVPLHELPPEKQVSDTVFEEILEREKAGILNWMIEGWVALQREGLNPPEDAAQIKVQQRSLADPIGDFLKECTTAEAASSIQSSDLHRVFEAWCERSGIKPFGITKFGRTLINKGLLRTKSHGVNVWRHLDWSKEDHVFELVMKTLRDAPP
ncbi:DNA primase family protein [Rhodovulum sp. DZ06]|uniref:DNA primase family protein n=1 Tax=Rhodovulum sp. DZ06 TaxID=3425126 RepID=UPI003D3305DB